MRREGSPWQGLGTVFVKELADHVTSVRMRVLEILIVVIAVLAVAGALGQIRDTTAEDPFVLLKLFTVTKWPPLSLIVILGILIPLPAICLACDAVNGEHLESVPCNCKTSFRARRWRFALRRVRRRLSIRINSASASPNDAISMMLSSLASV